MVKQKQNMGCKEASIVESDKRQEFMESHDCTHPKHKAYREMTKFY